MMKASPGARSWMAAGVRHELLSRVLPALRHDMVGPVSVMRMGLLTLKRQVEADRIDAQACHQRVALLDDQVVELCEGVRALRDWELATDSDDGITRGALVAQCAALLRTPFDLHGVTVESAAQLQDARAAGERRWPRAAALRYLLLCALSYLHDSAPALRRIRIEAEGEDGLRLVASAQQAQADDAAPEVAVHRAPRQLAIDAVALQNLADDLGYAITLHRPGDLSLSLSAR